MKKTIILFLIFPILLYSCSEKVSKTEYDKLVTKISEMEELIQQQKKEISIYRNSPEKILAKANEAYKSDNIIELSTLLEQIKQYHPETNEKEVIEKMYDGMIKAEQDKIEKEKKERLKAVNKLKKRYDDVSGTTWYNQPYFTHYNDRNLMSLYMGQKDSDVWLRLKMSYQGSDWIFFKHAYLSYDGTTREITFDDYRDRKSDNSGYGVWEWIDVPVDDSILSFLQNYKNGKVLKMRLSGKYTHTRTLSTNEVKGIKDILLAYDVLKRGV